MTGGSSIGVSSYCFFFFRFIAENHQELAAIKFRRGDLNLTAAASWKRIIRCETAWSSTKLERRLEDLHISTEVVQRAMPPSCCAGQIRCLKLVSPLSLQLFNVTFDLTFFLTMFLLLGGSIGPMFLFCEEIRVDLSDF